MTPLSPYFLAGVVACLTLVAPSRQAEQRPTDKPRDSLRALIQEQWEWQLRETPEIATMIGDYRYNDRWTDISLEHTHRRREELQRWKARFEAIDVAGLADEDRLNRSLMIRALGEEIEAADLKTHLMPVDQFNGLHIVLPLIVTIAPFDSTKHYEDYLARLRQIPRLGDDLIAVLRAGMSERLMPPRFLLEKTVEQCQAIASPRGEANPFASPLTRFPDAVPSADRARMRTAILEAVDNHVRPTYRRLASFIRDEYAPRGRAEPGVWALPDGEVRYRFAVRRMTTTRMEPEAIHQLGLQEVKRIAGEQLAIAKGLGFQDLKVFRASLPANPALRPKSPEHLLDTYRRYIAQMERQLPKLFGLLPKTGVEVRPVQRYREKEAAAAEYTPGTPDGSRPGTVFVNTYEYEKRSLLTAEATAYHEGHPGHHMQVSIAQALKDLPPFRRYAYQVAYIEGWALYSERLGKEVGFYKDPFSDFGRLGSEMLRAVRLVLDTGVHHKRWTRRQMVDFFREHSFEDEPDIQAETDRYIVLPGQALAYKIGQMSILDLRRKAERELGACYDIRGFHDQVLGGGPLPLEVLEGRLAAWVATERAVAGR